MDRAFQNLVEMQQHACRIHSHRKMYGTKGDDGQFTWTTYGQFGEAVDRFRSGLARLGISRGDKVAVISGNCVEWAVGCYAVYGLAAHYVPMYESQKREEWAYILEDSGARVLLVKRPEIAGELAGLVDEIPGLERIIPLYDDPGMEWSYPKLCGYGAQHPVPAVQPGPEEPMGLIYTSGTTGNPKGVILSHRSMITEIRALMDAAANDPFTPEDRGLSFLPWGHLMGQLQEVHILIYTGFSSGLVRDINEIVEDLSAVRPTLFFAVPRLYTRLYEGVMKNIREKSRLIQALFSAGINGAVRMNRQGAATPWDRVVTGLARRLVFSRIRELFGGRLRMAFSGGAALNENVVEFLDAIGIPVYEGYGQTETTMAVTMNVPGLRKSGSVGRPIPNARVEIDTTVVDTDNGEGEIVVSGPLLMLGYHNLPEETAATIGPDGGCRTGDIGRFDADGFLHLTGRIKEIYKLENGKYVSPGPLEEELKLSPYINQALVFGLNRPYNVAVITPEETAVREWAASNNINTDDPAWQESPAIQQLFQQEIEKCSARFKKFETPRQFKLVWEEWSVDNALLTPTLKLKRRQVTRRFQAEIETLYDVGN